MGRRNGLCCSCMLFRRGQGLLYPWTPHSDTRDLNDFVKLNIDQCILCFWFRASLICINNCPTRCNTKQSIYYSASSLYMFRVPTTPIIRSTQNCNYSLRYCAATSLQLVGGSCTQKILVWPVPEAVVTVLWTPDDGCGWHPKHVEWTCRIINRLLCFLFILILANLMHWIL